MESLLQNFGIDWKILASQAVNFFILLVILRYTVYTPLLNMIAERRRRIKDGLAKAEEADRRLASVTEIQKEKRREAEEEGLRIIHSAEEKAKAADAAQMEEATKKVLDIQKRGASALEAERVSMMAAVEHDAVGLVKSVIAKAVGAAPEMIDEALLKKVVEQTKLSKRS